MLKKWDDLPNFMKSPEVKHYWEILSKRRAQIALKRFFDLVVAVILFVILAIPMAFIAVLITALRAVLRAVRVRCRRGLLF